MEKHIHIISRAYAKQLGMKRYFTGKPCNKGHIAERYTSGGDCIQCIAESRARWNANNPDRKAEVQKKWHEENRERHLQACKAWREKNKERKAEANKRWYEANKDKVAEQGRRWREENKDRKSEVNKRWYRENKERHLGRAKLYYKNNKEKITKINLAWKSRNQQKMREYKNEWMRERRIKDPDFKMMEKMRGMIARTLANKTERTQDVLGYTASDLRTHLERQFTKGMTWDNYGDWHIDHIYPISKFIDEGTTDPKKINCLSNLRPMWSADNIRKNNKVETLL